MTSAMGFQETDGDGNFLPIIKYNAKLGKLYKRERYKDGNDAWQSNDIEIPLPVAFAADFDTVQVGWVNFHNTVSKHLVPIGQPFPNKPDEHHKQGFDLAVCSLHFNGIREWCSGAGCVRKQVDKLFETYLAGRQMNAGKVPVIQMTGIMQESTSQGDNFAPQMQIVDWAPRPEEFVKAAADRAKKQAQAPAGAMANQSTVPPPTQQLPADQAAAAQAAAAQPVTW